MRKYLLCFALLIGSTISDSFAAAGKFNFVIGDVRVTNAAGSRVAAKGMEIEQRDTIIAGQNSMAQLRLTDGAFIALRANTEMRLDQYKFESSQSPSNNAVISLLKGTMRAFTGAIAVFNKDRFKMKTRSATIGIRGSGNVLNYSPENNQTINHTIEGSHTVSTMDARGSITTLVTMPGQTVQVNANGAMKFIPTPAFILESQNSKKEEPHDTNTTEKSASQSESKKEEKKEGRKEDSRDAKGESKPANEKGPAPKPEGEKKPGTPAADEKTKAPMPPAEGKIGLPLGEPGRFPGEMPRNGYAQTPPLPGSFMPPPFFPAFNPIYPTNNPPPPIFKPCTLGEISGSLFCDGSFFITPVLGRPCPGSISVGAFTCSNHIWVSTSLNTYTVAGTPVWGEACSAPGAVSDTLYCDGKTWITPTLGSACVGSGTAGAFTCSGGIWISTTSTSAAGTPTMGSACTTAGDVFDTLYCNGTTWITPTLGSTCAGAQTAGALGCQIGVWVSVGTPAFAATPATGWMYDAYGAIVAIPANGYRYVSYIYGLMGGAVAM
ncbi:MAG: FecR family protein, partial [Gallionellaceae bacterium]